MAISGYSLSMVFTCYGCYGYSLHQKTTTSMTNWLILLVKINGLSLEEQKHQEPLIDTHGQQI